MSVLLFFSGVAGTMVCYTLSARLVLKRLATGAGEQRTQQRAQEHGQKLKQPRTIAAATAGVGAVGEAADGAGAAAAAVPPPILGGGYTQDVATLAFGELQHRCIRAQRLRFAGVGLFVLGLFFMIVVAWTMGCADDDLAFADEQRCREHAHRSTACPEYARDRAPMVAGGGGGRALHSCLRETALVRPSSGVG